VDAFNERLQDRLILRAATIDELLSDDFQTSLEPDLSQTADDAVLTRRLTAWCRSSAAGDRSLFERRLQRDGWPLAHVRERLGVVRRRASAAIPRWIGDALWIEAALQSAVAPVDPVTVAERAGPYPFEQLFTPVVVQADALAWSGLDGAISHDLTDNGRASLRLLLLQALSDLAVAALYERFAKARQDAGVSYGEFVAAMKAGGFRQLFVDKPVLLRLIAVLTRQWIDTAREFVRRLAADLPALRGNLLPSSTPSRVTKIEGDLSDPHNGGRSVLILSFEDGARLVYKPKDLRLDIAWHDLIASLNRAGAPVMLKAVLTLARDGYGWTEFIDHTGCADPAGCDRFFRRAGALLALLHCFVSTDMHQENIIAAGDHPVPIDLETILQPSADEHKALDPEGQAFDAALDIVGNSVMTVGLLPAYGRSVDNHVFAMGGLTGDWNLRTVVKWNDVNADAMRPVKVKEHSPVTPNLPHVGGHYAKFTDHVESFVGGFGDYAKFLLRHVRATTAADLLANFAALPVRKVIRPTRFYYMLLQRLKDHRTMDDGAAWSAQADFVTRLSEWDKDDDPLWPLYRAERAALLTLNVPHFVMASDGDEVGDTAGIAVRTAATSGFERALARLQNLDESEIAWQIDVIRENTNAVVPAGGSAPAVVVSPPLADTGAAPTTGIFIAEANRIADEVSRLAVRRGPGAAWIGLDWLGDAEVFQLVCLGPDLYNGATGIALFLAAHAAVTGNEASGELALAGLSHIRKNLKGANAPRVARSLGLGAATGLGSVVYAFAVIAKCLRNDDLFADALAAAGLFTGDLIAADKRLDIMGGSAGAILALLRLHRDSQSPDALARAIRCGEHLLGQKRLEANGQRSWIGEGFGSTALNGMSHGAAGFAYALASLAAATGRDDFAKAAADCVAFENASYDAARHNWPDLRGGGAPHWPCQWCHGVTGIGLARFAAVQRGAADSESLLTDLRNAVDGVERGTGLPVDTLCCGTLGTIEFFCEAGAALERDDLRRLAAQRLKAVVDRARAAGDYRWNSGQSRFNLGLFRGLSGVGYTLLRQADPSLPNVIVWE
jgi:type 2 lantibiotic biosynthesis protein LanM